MQSVSIPFQKKTIRYVVLFLLVAYVALIPFMQQAKATNFLDCKFFKQGGYIKVEVFSLNPGLTTYVQAFRWNSYPPPNGSHPTFPWQTVNVFRVNGSGVYTVSTDTNKDWFRVRDTYTGVTGCTYGYNIADEGNGGGSGSS